MIAEVAAGFALLYVGRDVVIPMAMAFVFALLLRPVVRRAERWKIPTPVAALGIIATGLLLLWGIGFALAPAVEKFVHQLPEVAATAGTKVRTLPAPLNQVARLLPPAPDSSGESAAQHGGTSAGAGGGAGSSSGASGAGSGAMGMATKAFGTASSIVSTALEIVLLLLFFLAAGDTPRRHLMKSTTTLARELVAVSDEVGSVVSRYLSLLALINLVQGTIIALAMWAVGMPVPPVWGALAFVAEFFPYLGGATMVVLLTLVGLASAGGGHLLLAPVIYLVITTLQNSVVSPVTYGRYLRLSPAAILLSVMLWWLVWGVLGAFLAVPILATVHIVCERQKGKLAALGALIGE